MRKGEAFTFVRDVGPGTWVALPREFKKGEEVHKFIGHTYGCDRDDAMQGYETIACTDDGERYFTVPVTLLRDARGFRPAGAYAVKGCCA